MSVLTYRGIRIPYPHTVMFRMDPVYDDMSSTDWCCTRYDIQIQGVLTVELGDYAAFGFVGSLGGVADLAVALRQKLLQPRGSLSFTFNGRELIPQPQQGTTGPVDARNGPKPVSCSVLPLTNTSFLITYHITAHYWENFGQNFRGEPNFEGPNQAGNPVVFNRWSETTDIDKLSYTTRTREGRYMIRSDNVNGLTADRLRSQMAVVSVPWGFLRESSRYTISPDGLAIQYTIVDKEQYKMPPEGAFEATGYYIERSNKGDAKRIVEVLCNLKGPRRGVGNPLIRSQSDLLRTAAAVCARKLNLNGVFFAGVEASRAIPDEARVKVDMYRNEVEVYIRAITAVGVRRIAGTMAFSGTNMTFTPLTDDAPEPSHPPAYLDYGNLGFMTQAAAYYDPSILGVVLGDGSYQSPTRPFTEIGGDRVQMTQGNQPGTEGVA